MADVAKMMQANEFKTEILNLSDNSGSNCVLIGNGIELILPFPLNLQSVISPQWEGTDSSMMQKVGQELLTGGFSSTADTIKGWGQQSKNMLKSLSGKNTSSTALVVGAVVGGYDKVLHKARKAINPFKEMMFNGLSFRSFELNFEFVLVKAEQNEELADILKELQMRSSPEILDGGTGLFMEYPDTWELSLEPTEEYLPSFLPFVVTNISVNYAGKAGRIIFKESEGPLSVNVDISCSEVELLTKSKIKEGYWG